MRYCVNVYDLFSLKNGKLHFTISLILAVGSRVSQSHGPSKVMERSPTRPVAALIPEEENIVDDWLIDDVVPRKRQRTDIASVFTGLALQKQHGPKEKRPHVQLDDSDSDEVILSNSPTDQSHITDVDGYNRVSQTQFRTGNVILRKSAKKQQRIDTFTQSSSHHQERRSVLPSRESTNQRPGGDVSSTATSHQVAAFAVMRLRVNVQGKVILVPVMPR